MPYPRVSLVLHGRGNPALAMLYAIKDRALATIYRIYPDPEASLMAGILRRTDSQGLEADDILALTAGAWIVPSVLAAAAAFVGGLVLAARPRVVDRVDQIWPSWCFACRLSGSA